MLQLTFNPVLTLTGFRTTRPWLFGIGNLSSTALENRDSNQVTDATYIVLH